MSEDPFAADMAAKGIGGGDPFADDGVDPETPWLRKGYKPDPFAADLEKKGFAPPGADDTSRKFRNTGPDVAGQLKEEAAAAAPTSIAHDIGQSFSNFGSTVAKGAGAAARLISPVGTDEKGDIGLHVPFSDLTQPAYRRQVERGVSDVGTGGLAERAANSADRWAGKKFGWDADFAGSADTDAAAAPGAREAAQLGGSALPSPFRWAGETAAPVAGALAERAGVGTVGQTAARGLAAYEGQAIPQALVAGPDGHRLEAAERAAVDPAGLALSAGLPAAREAASEALASSPSIAAARAKMIQAARGYAVKDLGSDITSAGGSKARATDQKRIAEVNERLFTLAQELDREKPGFRNVFRQPEAKASPKIDKVLQETVEPRAGLYDELDAASVAPRRMEGAVPQAIEEGDFTRRLEDPNFRPEIEGPAGGIPVTEGRNADLPETPSTARQTGRYDAVVDAPPRRVAEEAGYVPVGDEILPRRVEDAVPVDPYEVAPSDIISEADAPQGGLTLRDVVEGHRQAARDAVDPTKGGGRFGIPDAARFNHAADQYIEVYGKANVPRFDPDTIVNEDGMTAGEMLKILGRRPDSPGAQAAMQQVVDMATKTGIPDLDVRIPSLHFRKEVTESGKAAESVLGGLEGTPRYEALQALHEVGQDILNKHIDESGMAPERIAQLRKMNDRYFLLKRAQTAMESRGWKEANKPGWKLPHTIRAAEVGGLGTMAAYGAVHPHAILPMAATYGAAHLLPAALNRLNWKIANMDPVRVPSTELAPSAPVGDMMWPRRFVHDVGSSIGDTNIANVAAADRVPQIAAQEERENDPNLGAPTGTSPDDLKTLAKMALGDPDASPREKARALQILRGE